ncbi:hypothetical protein GFS24_07615 [Chitinophaga sp. SYP-B3965]|uniref:PKD domain-containing protein n=1 Tax=Chitinophaga sp. SYP-B3965 TaxID=2663120 RepID=UPI001299F5C4|nr:PKD domain-containing protein [Chitinophaga sp. SYP-B3965]MRG44976.1 hypothetical protein [Chitinophaga sp. SYP-B3965]
MNTFIKILMVLLVFSSCKKADRKFGPLVTPSKPELTVTVIGKDATHPTGDGSGTVKVVATSTNAINYKVDFGDGLPALLTTNNEWTYKFSHTGTKKLTITVIASGKAGISSSNSTEIEIFRAFVPNPALVTMLTNNGTKKWRVDKDAGGHLGVSDAAVNIPAWWSAGPNEKAGLGIYDDEYTFSVTGNTFSHKTNNDMFGQKQYFKDFDPTLTGEGDFTLTGTKAADYTESFGYDGSPTTEIITFANKGHMGMYFGVHRYQVLERSATKMTLRCLQAPGAWYVKIIAIP